MTSANMLRHIKDTATNYQVHTNGEANGVVRKLDIVEHALHAFYDKMAEAV
jgi:hypothetical protein